MLYFTMENITFYKLHVASSKPTTIAKCCPNDDAPNVTFSRVKKPCPKVLIKAGVFKSFFTNVAKTISDSLILELERKDSKIGIGKMLPSLQPQQLFEKAMKSTNLKICEHVNKFV